MCFNNNEKLFVPDYYQNNENHLNAFVNVTNKNVQKIIRVNAFNVSASETSIARVVLLITIQLARSALFIVPSNAPIHQNFLILHDLCCARCFWINLLQHVLKRSVSWYIVSRKKSKTSRYHEMCVLNISFYDALFY